MNEREATLFFKTKTIIDNSLNDPIVLNAVDEYGYDAAEFDNGKRLLKEAEDSTQVKVEESAETKELKVKVAEAHEKYFKEYSDNLKIARIVFRGNDKIATMLKLNGLRKRATDEATAEADLFYKVALNSNEILEGLKKHKRTREKLEKAYDLLKQFIALNNEMKIEKGDDYILTKEKNLKVEALERWYKDYEVIVKIALKDSPEQLKKLLP